MPVYITPQKVKMRQLSGNNSDQFYGIDVIAAENSIIPAAPTTDGNYILKCTVASGTATYTWETQESD